MRAEPPLIHMPYDVLFQLSTGDYSVLRIEIFTTVIIKNVSPNMASFSELPVTSVLRVLWKWRRQICKYTGLFEMIVGILTTCHTQYTWDRSICVFIFNRTTLHVFGTYLTGAVYVNPLWFYKPQHNKRVRYKLIVACQRWWFQWRFWFVPSVPGYVRYVTKTWSVVLLNKKKNTYTPISSVLCMTSC